MIDIKDLAENPDKYKEFLTARKDDAGNVNKLIDLDDKRKEIIGRLEKLRADKKQISKSFGIAKREGNDTSKIENQIKDIDDKLQIMDKMNIEIQDKFNGLLLRLPNILLEDTPRGNDETQNVVVREWGQKPAFSFKVKDHVELGENLGIIDFKRAAKVTGARFVFMNSLGAKLERSLINFMLDVHTKEHGYTELLTPLMVNDNSLTGTGQLPKFSEDLFKIEKFPYYLIPTAEVPVTNFYADEILEESILPVKFAAFSSCFRSEAGSYGKDTRGMTRQHQFNKVELVKICKNTDSVEEHEALTRDAEKILQKLGLHYRVNSLCSGDIGFGAAKCYDLEVWLPSQNTYREISSCSNFWDFQARRAKIRYRDPENKKPVTAHTINGSGLAIGRTVIAIMENYQQEDGSIKIPEVLVPYMGVDLIK